MSTLKKSASKFGVILDPFIILGIFVLFLVPVLTVLNLTPIYKPVINERNILGVSETSTVTFETNTEIKEGISTEMVAQHGPDSYMFQVNTEPMEKGTHQNKLFNVYNPLDEQKTLNISSNFEGIPHGTQISIMVDGVKFVILDTNGTTYPPTIYVAAKESLDAFTVIEVPENVNFSSEFGVGVMVD